MLVPMLVLQTFKKNCPNNIFSIAHSSQFEVTPLCKFHLLRWFTNFLKNCPNNKFSIVNSLQFELTPFCIVYREQF